MSLRISKLAEIGIDPEMSPEMLDDYMADFTVPWDQWGSTFFMLPQLCLREVTPQIMMEISLERFLNTPLQIGFLKSEVWSIQSLFVSIATVDARQHANSDILLTMRNAVHTCSQYTVVILKLVEMFLTWMAYPRDVAWWLRTGNLGRGISVGH